MFSLDRRFRYNEVCRCIECRYKEDGLYLNDVVAVSRMVLILLETGLQSMTTVTVSLCTINTTSSLCLSLLFTEIIPVSLFFSCSARVLPAHIVDASDVSLIIFQFRYNPFNSCSMLAALSVFPGADNDVISFQIFGAWVAPVAYISPPFWCLRHKARYSEPSLQ